jgi:hypothetical protein
MTDHDPRDPRQAKRFEPVESLPEEFAALLNEHGGFGPILATAVLGNATMLMTDYPDIAPRLLNWATKVRTDGMNGDLCGVAVSDAEKRTDRRPLYSWWELVNRENAYGDTRSCWTRHNTRQQAEAKLATLAELLKAGVVLRCFVVDLEVKAGTKGRWGLITDAAILAQRERAARGSDAWIESRHRAIVAEASRDRRREPIPQ